MRWTGLAAAVSAVAIGTFLAAGCGVISRNMSSVSTVPAASTTVPTPTVPTSSPTSGGTPAGTTGLSPKTTTAPQMLPAGQVGQRSDVPWSLIGPGWFLAEWAPTAFQNAATASIPNPPGTVLFLVDESGGRYALASGPSIPPGELVSWSGDGKRALFEATEGGVANDELTVLDLTNGTKTAFQVPITGSSAAFTKPDGLAILTGGLPPTPAQRFDLSGVVQYRFPTSFDQVGPVYGGVDSPDGTELAFDASNVVSNVFGAGVALVSNQGQLLRYIPIPVAGLCSTLRWWSSTEVLVQCGPDAGHSLWLVPTDGSSPTQLASANDAWPLSSGVYGTTGRCNMGACSFGVLKLQPDGAMAQVPVPLGWASGMSVGPLGAFQNRLGVIGEPSSLMGIGEQADGFLSWFDPQTGTVTPLLGGSVNGGSVNAALMHETPVPATAPPS